MDLAKIVIETAWITMEAGMAWIHLHAADFLGDENFHWTDVKSNENK